MSKITKIIPLVAICILMFFSNCLFSQDANNSINNIKDNDLNISEKISSFRSPTKATLLSLAYPGVGQFYNRQKNKALGYIAWKVVSDISLILSFYGLSNDNNWLSKDKGNEYAYLILGSLTSAFSSWVVSMIDANLSARKTNRHYGYSNLETNSRRNISINPDFNIVQSHQNTNSNKSTCAFGISLKLSF